MKGIDKVILDGVIPSGVTALADANMTEVDLSTVSLSREFILSLRCTPNTTAVGADRWLAINWYWSDYQIATPSTYVVLNLLKRKQTTGAMLLTNATLANNGLTYYELTPAIEIQPTTITASTTTATATFVAVHGLSVGDWITISGGTVTGNGDYMQGTYQVAAVSSTTVVTYTITSSSGTLVGATVRTADLPKRLARPTASILRPKSRYLYVSVDRSALDASSTTALTLNLVRVPSAGFNL